MRPRRQLRNFLINRPYQGKFVLWAMVCGVIGAVLPRILYDLWFADLVADVVARTGMRPEAQAEILAGMDRALADFVPWAAVFLSAAAPWLIVVSHRTAGPMQHFKRVFREIREGNEYQRVHLRAKDEFQDVAREFNRMMDSLPPELRSRTGRDSGEQPSP